MHIYLRFKSRILVPDGDPWGPKHVAFIYDIIKSVGAWGSVVVKALHYKSDGPGIDSRWCHWIFQWHTSFRLYHGPGVDSAPRKNEYQEHSWE
jgi:hypothetical protein